MFTRLLTTLTAAAIAAPALAAEVNVYSYRQPELIEPMTKAFTADTGIDVNVVFLKKGLVERLKQEGDLSPADLILTVDISRVLAAVNAGVTQPISSPTLDANVPEAFRDPDDHWYGLTARARIIYASKDRVGEGEVTTYEDLADPKWKGRICTRSGMHSYTLGLLGAVIAKHGPEAAEAWAAGIKSNLARKPQGNDRAQVKAIWAGECDLAIGNNYYMVKMLENDEQKSWADSAAVVFPTFENGGTHMNISGVAMTKSAPNKDNALKLMEWLSSDKAQNMYANVNGEYPVKPGVDPSDVVKSFGSFTPDETPLVEIGNARKDAVKIMETINFDG
ncbi:MAG: Fe(3+) ABC transporter substrate-binding protein [Pseudomonadota bacterium]